MKDEVEMEDVDEDSLVDIDSGDKNNSLAIVEYIDDLYSYYKKAEVIPVQNYTWENFLC